MKNSPKHIKFNNSQSLNNLPIFKENETTKNSSHPIYINKYQKVNSLSKGKLDIDKFNHPVINDYLSTAFQLKHTKEINNNKSANNLLLKSHENIVFPEVKGALRNLKKSEIGNSNDKTGITEKKSFNNSVYSKITENNFESTKSRNNISNPYKFLSKSQNKTQEILDKSLNKLLQRTNIFQEFEKKHGDANLRSYVIHNSVNFLNKVKEKGKESIEKTVRIQSPNYFKKRSTLDGKVIPMKIKANNQMDLNKHLINNFNLGQIDYYIQNSNKLNELSDSVHKELIQRSMKKLNIPDDYNIEVSAFDETNNVRIAISTPPKRSAEKETENIFYLLENIICPEYEDISHPRVSNTGLSLSNLNRVIQVRNVLRKKAKQADCLFSIKLEDIIKNNQELSSNPKNIEIVRYFPKKLIKQSFKKETIAKFVSIEGKNFGSN